MACNRFCIQEERKKVLHFKFTLSITGIFRHDFREKKEGDKWGGRHIWFEEEPITT